MKTPRPIVDQQLRDLLPPLSSDRLADLQADLEINGQKDPIIVDEDGRILDGHHRHAIIGDAVKFEVRRGMPEDFKAPFVIAVNFNRRNLSPEQQRELCKKQAKLAVAMKVNGRRQVEIGQAFGVDQATVSRWLDGTISNMRSHIAYNLRIKIGKRARLAIVESVEAGKTQAQVAADYGITQPRVSQILRAAKREAKPAAAGVDLPAADFEQDDVRLLLGDFRKRLAVIEDGSVDLILTDPPYPKEDLSLWSDLSKEAARLLGKRGLLFAYSGQIYLPEIISRLSEHLTYGWTFALMLPGESSRIKGRHIIQAWKPVLAFSTGTWPSGEWADDVLVSPQRTKDLYEWQQNIEPAKRIIERFSAPGALVVDPFLGVGTFALAAKEVNRRFVGVEADDARFAKVVERLS